MFCQLHKTAGEYQTRPPEDVHFLWTFFKYLVTNEVLLNFLSLLPVHLRMSLRISKVASKP